MCAERSALTHLRSLVEGVPFSSGNLSDFDLDTHPPENLRAALKLTMVDKYENIRIRILKLVTT
jgi:hypothetical protein